MCVLTRSSSVLDRPFASLVFEVFWFGDHLAGHHGILWVFRFGSGKEGLEGEERGFDAEDWSPALFEGVKANGSLENNQQRSFRL